MTPSYLLLVTVFAGVFHGNSASEIAPVAVKMSSVWTGIHGEWTSLPGYLCIDNNRETKCHTKGDETWPWVAVEIPPSRVQQVNIVNRADCCGDRTKNVKVWVGDSLPTTTDTEYSQGALLGEFKGPANNGSVIQFTNPQGLEGKYVIVQMTQTKAINLAEIEVFGAPTSMREITPVEVKMSSVWTGIHGEWTSLPGYLCIDNNQQTKCHTKGDETWPWVAVEIPPSRVQQVNIVNRADCCGERTKNVKVWVGDSLPTTSNTEYSQGALLGEFKGPANNGSVIQFTHPQGLEGKFVIVQMTQTKAINLAEINVFGAPTSDPDDCYCGLAKRRPTRIQGGEETEVNEYPWQVLLKYRGSFICGGSLISDQWVFTAAHCVDFVAKESDLKVDLGEHDRTDSDEADTIQMDVRKIIIHEKWDSSSIRYDFALLRLTSKINFDSHPHIRPICLPADGSNNDYSGYTATATGWGTTSYDAEDASPHLLEVDLSVVTETECSQRAGSLHIEQVLCAKGNGENGVCRGDSGGPLVTKETGDSGTLAGENYELIGVTSFGRRGSCKNTIQGFARVTAQLEWIREKTKDSWRTCPRT